MKSVDGKIYFDPLFKRYYIKIRDIGYEEYVYVDPDGDLHYVSGCVGLEFGWECKDIKSEEEK